MNLALKRIDIIALILNLKSRKFRGLYISIIIVCVFSILASYFGQQAVIIRESIQREVRIIIENNFVIEDFAKENSIKENAIIENSEIHEKVIVLDVQTLTIPKKVEISSQTKAIAARQINYRLDTIKNYFLDYDNTYENRYEIQDIFNEITKSREMYPEDFKSLYEETIELKMQFFNILNAVENYDEISERFDINAEMDASKQAPISKEEFTYMISNMEYDKVGFFKENAEYIWNCSKENSVNVIFVCGIIALESGWGKHSEYNNFTGQTKKNGESFSYDSIEEGIKATIENLHYNYLTDGGQYHNGYTVKDVNKHYNSVNPNWLSHVLDCMESIIKAEKKQC